MSWVLKLLALVCIPLMANAEVKVVDKFADDNGVRIHFVVTGAETMQLVVVAGVVD